MICFAHLFAFPHCYVWMETVIDNNPYNED